MVSIIIMIHFLDCWRAGSAMAGYNDYYGTTQYNGDNLRHPDGHSKIVGIAFDGFPSTDLMLMSPWDNLAPLEIMTSSYQLNRLKQMEDLTMVILHKTLLQGHW